jgi:enamine deaminase RidA (YjgF/YER057c/UK114 family)
VSEKAESEVSPHRFVNPETLPPPLGFSHAVVPSPGRTVWLGGQAAHGQDGTITADTMVEQFDAAAANVVRALEAAGGRPEHIVSMQILVTDADEYRGSLREIGAAYRGHFGRHYPAMALLEVSGLFDPAAKIELVAVAVVPD